jgi:hypothetical protein
MIHSAATLVCFVVRVRRPMAFESALVPPYLPAVVFPWEIQQERGCVGGCGWVSVGGCVWVCVCGCVWEGVGGCVCVEEERD